VALFELISLASIRKFLSPSVRFFFSHPNLRFLCVSRACNDDPLFIFDVFDE
jgi:hypothetical protein